MKTFFQIRQELNEGYESNQIKKAATQRLSQGTGTEHSGHDGMATYHASMAGKYKGTEAGKHHQRASDHHARALQAINKGNLKGGLTHAKNALDAAKAAHNSHNSRHSKAGMLDSMKLHRDHNSDVNAIGRAKERDDKYAQKDKPKRSDKPIARAIGKTKSKIKKVLRMGEEVKESVASVAASAQGDHKAHMKAAKAHAIAAIKHMDQYKETNDPAHQKAAKLHRKAEQSHEGTAKLHKTSNNGQTKMTRTSIANKATAAANAASEEV